MLTSQLVFTIYVPITGEGFLLGESSDWKEAWGEGGLACWLATQVCFFCGNLLSDILSIYVKLNKNVNKGKQLSRNSFIYYH